MTSIISIYSVRTAGAALAVWAAQDTLEQGEDAVALLGFREQVGAACAITQR